MYEAFVWARRALNRPFRRFPARADAAKTLTLLPHLPDNITSLEQKFPIRWGAYRLWISCSGVRSSGIQSVTVNGSVPSQAHPFVTFNATAAVFAYDALPVPSAAAAAATDSDVSSASDALLVKITFKTAGAKDEPAKASTTRPRSLRAGLSLDCATIRKGCTKGGAWKWPRGACGLTAPEAARLTSFVAKLGAAACVGCVHSLPHSMAQSSLAFMGAFDQRCAGLNNGSITTATTVAEKSLQDLLAAAGNVYSGLNNSMANRYARSTEPLAKAIVAAWA